MVVWFDHRGRCCSDERRGGVGGVRMVGGWDDDGGEVEKSVSDER